MTHVPTEQELADIKRVLIAAGGAQEVLYRRASKIRKDAGEDDDPVSRIANFKRAAKISKSANTIGLESLTLDERRKEILTSMSLRDELDRLTSITNQAEEVTKRLKKLAHVLDQAATLINLMRQLTGLVMI